MAGGVAQVVECLPSKCEALSFMLVRSERLEEGVMVMRVIICLQEETSSLAWMPDL
jgi:hypothetical protein